MSDQITLNFGTGWSCDSVTGSAVRDVTTEREKQIDKGYTPEHDEFHGVIHLWSEAHRRLVELNLGQHQPMLPQEATSEPRYHCGHRSLTLHGGWSAYLLRAEWPSVCRAAV